MDSAITFPIFGDNFIIDTPRFVTLFGFKLYLYGFFITAGFILAGLYCYRRRKKLELTSDNVLDLIIMAVPFGLLGARIYFILFNASDYFGAGKWQNMFLLREGGLAVYGGVIAAGIAFLVYSRIKKIPVTKLLDAAGFGLFIGQAVGRWGNFFNREAYGTETSLPWRMGLETEISLMPGLPKVPATVYVHPTFLYESLWNIAGLLIMHILSSKQKTKYHGQYFLFYVAWYGFGRYIIEGLRTDSLMLGSTDVRVSQLLAAVSFSVAVYLLVRNHLRGYTSYSPLKAVDEGNGTPGPADEEPDTDTDNEIDTDTDEESTYDNAIIL